MNQDIKGDHKVDSQGNPAGGKTTGLGISIDWQDGPIPRDEKGKPTKAANGAFVEGVIQAAIDRVEFYQKSKFKCSFNESIIAALTQAKNMCDKRTADRLARKVEGEHKV